MTPASYPSTNLPSASGSSFLGCRLLLAAATATERAALALALALTVGAAPDDDALEEVLLVVELGAGVEALVGAGAGARWGWGHCCGGCGWWNW